MRSHPCPTKIFCQFEDIYILHNICKCHDWARVGSQSHIPKCEHCKIKSGQYFLYTLYCLWQHKTAVISGVLWVKNNLFVSSDRRTNVNIRLSSSSAPCRHASSSQLDRNACRPDGLSTNEGRRHDYLGPRYRSSKEIQESTLIEVSQTRASQSTSACDVLSSPTATIPAPPTAMLTFSPPTRTATPAPKPTATVQLPAPEQFPAEKRPVPSPETEYTRQTQQKRRISPTVSVINDRPLTFTAAATTNDEKYKVPAYDSFDTRPREVGLPFPLKEKYKVCKTSKLFRIRIVYPLYVRTTIIHQELLDTSTRRRETNRHRPNDHTRPSTSIFQSASSLPRTASGLSSKGRRPSITTVGCHHVFKSVYKLIPAGGLGVNLGYM